MGRCAAKHGMQHAEVGILGGTFDPIHNGHLVLARSACDALGLDEVLFMPTNQPNFKQQQQVTPAPQRVAMVRLAIAGQPRFRLDCREVARGGVTYTLDTLEELAREYAGARLNFILGADSACSLVHWRGAERLVQLARFVVAARPGTSVQRVQQVHAASSLNFDLTFVEAPACDVSSTVIREVLCRGQQPPEGQLPPAVHDYICAQGLYTGPVGPKAGE